MPRISRRLDQLRPSATVAVANRAKELRRQGQDVLSFAAGEPDFDTPEPIKRAAIEALEAGQTRYMPTLGDHETRAVIAEKLVGVNGIPGLTGEHVAISAGGKHALFVALQCLIDPPTPDRPPDEVLLPVPAWVSYAPLSTLAGGKIVQIPTTAAGDFKMSPEQLESAITPRSRVLILNSPSNPCGTMYTPDELRALARVLVGAGESIAPDLVVVSDEIYERIIYGGIEHLSLASIDGLSDRTVTINGLSKAYAMTGWRVGYAAAAGEFGLRLIKAMGTLQGQMTTNITSFNYPAIRVALRECDEHVERMRRAFARRAGLIHERVEGIPGLVTPRPTGAFYIFPNIAAHFGRRTPAGRSINSPLDFAEAALAEAKIAVVPGEDFGGCGREHVRLSFACSEEQINAGMDRLETFVHSLE